MLFFEETIALRTNKVITISQIWNSLWQKVEQPKLFTPTIIKHQNQNIEDEKTIRRELDFGSHKIYDLITFEFQKWINFEIIPNNDLHASGSLKILIIANNPNSLGYVLISYPTLLGYSIVKSCYKYLPFRCPLHFLLKKIIA